MPRIPVWALPVMALLLPLGATAATKAGHGGTYVENPVTVAGLPAASSAGSQLAFVTDGLDASDCSTGGGSTIVLCCDTGASWAPCGDGNAERLCSANKYLDGDGFCYPNAQSCANNTDYIDKQGNCRDALDDGGTITGPLTIGDGSGNDYLEAAEESSNPACAAGDYRVWANSTDGKWKKCEDGVITDLDTGGSGGTECSTAGCSLNADTTIQSGTAPVVNAAGEIGVDTTDDQLVYYGTAERVLGFKSQACVTIENLAALDDNFQFWSTAAAVTITDFWCRYEGTGTTVATFALEDSGGTAMTHTAPTCVTGATNATVQGVTAANALVTGEGLRFDVTNAVSPETDTYTLCVLFTLTRT